MQKQYEHDGQMIIMRSPTVGSAYAADILTKKLARIYGGETRKVPDELLTPLSEYILIVSRTDAPGAEWWVSMLDNDDRIRCGFEAFMHLDIEFINITRDTLIASEPEKKTTSKQSKKSRPPKTS